jgi:ATP synthase protein I
LLTTTDATVTSHNERGESRSWDPADERDERPFRRLTREEAQALREREPAVSPWRVVGAQAVCGMVCVLIAWGLSTGSPGASWSAVYGAMAVVVPNALLARGMTRRAGSAVAAAAGFMFWEMLKIGVSIAMLVIAARVVPQLSWPVLLATMLVCMKVTWLALLWRGR